MLVRPEALDAQTSGPHTPSMPDRYPWTPTDPLGEALHFLRMSGAFYCRSELTTPWSLQLPPLPDCLSFHVLTAGAAWLEVEGSPPLRMGPGDLALVPHGRGHLMASEPGLPSMGRADLLPQEHVSEHYSVLRFGGGGTPAQLVCGVVQFEHPAARQLLALLPAVISVEAGSSSTEWMAVTLQLMAAEARALKPGGEAVITRLADILVIQAIRSWLAVAPAARQGWLGALQHEQIGRAILLVHRDPARPWTVASLAQEVAMSRSAFAARFTELVGEPAMHYVARWRMHTARSWLEKEGVPMSELASRLGYRSEAAFSRAFKRFLGVSPGSVRRRERASA
jgi:AraC-like DNA-binding protein